MMVLLQAWKESLSVLLPRNFKLFFLVTVKLILETISTWLRNFWWVLGIYFIMNIFTLWLYQFELQFMPVAEQAASAASNPAIIPLLNGASLVLAVMMLWTLLLTVRPSVQRKTFAYYLSYNWWPLSLFWITVVALNFIIKYLDHFIIALNYFKLMGMSVISPVMDMSLYILLSYIFMPFIPFGKLLGAGGSLIYAPLFILFVLAMLDMPVTVRNLLKAKVRTLKLIIFNYPLLFMVTGLFTALVSMHHYLSIMLIARVLQNATQFPLFTLIGFDIATFLVGALLYIIYVCIMSNLYTKQVHEQFARYF